MVNEDNNEDQVQTKEEASFDAKGELEALREQLAEMNNSYQAGMQSIVDTVTAKKEPEQSFEEDFLTNEEKRIKKLESQLSDLQSNSNKNTQDLIRRERELDSTVVRLAQEFPEIQSDIKVQKAVQAEHSKLAKSMQDTPDGYELAVSRAIKKAGLKPRSERDSNSDDFAAPGNRSGSGSASTRKGKTKVDEKTLQFAALLGRDIEDPKVLEGLEKASSRERWLKYR